MARRDPWLFVGVIGLFSLVLVVLFGERFAPNESIFFVPVNARSGEAIGPPRLQ